MILAIQIIRLAVMLALSAVTIIVQLFIAALRFWKVTLIAIIVAVILNWDAICTFVYNFFNY